MEFFDHETNVVSFASALEDRYPDIFNEMKEFLIENDLEVDLLGSATNIWIRDWAPVQVGNRLIKFRYKKDFRRYPQLRSTDGYWIDLNLHKSVVILDGGNLVRYGDQAIITKKVIEDNPKSCIGTLENLLKAEITLIPVEPYDTLGHADGICKFIDEKNVLINDYSVMPQKYYRIYEQRLVKALNKFNIHTFPFAYHKTPWMSEEEFRKKFYMGDDFSPAFGYYINILQVKGLILLPKFDISEDEEALNAVRVHFPECKVKQIDCSRLSLEGGLLNCISVNWKI